MTMSVTVRVPTPLRTETAGTASLTVDASGTLRAVLNELAVRWPRLNRRLRDDQGSLRRYVNIYIDNIDCRETGGLDSPVPTTAEIHILPSVAGG